MPKSFCISEEASEADATDYVVDINYADDLNSKKDSFSKAKRRITFTEEVQIKSDISQATGNTGNVSGVSTKTCSKHPSGAAIGVLQKDGQVIMQ